MVIVATIMAITVTAQKNVSLRFLTIGGDGFSVMNGFELNIENKLQPFAIRLGYAQASKLIRLDDSHFTDRMEIIQEHFIGEKNTSSNPVVHYNQYRAYSLGMSKQINASHKSNLAFYIGARYEILNILSFASSGPSPDIIKSANKNESGLSLALELVYNYNLTDVIALQGAFYYSSRLLVFAGSLGVSVTF